MSRYLTLCCSILVLFVLGATTTLSAADQPPVVLQYISDTPIDHTNSIEVVISAVLPDQNLHFYTKQVLKNELRIIPREEGQDVIYAPFELEITPKSVTVDVKINGAHIVSYEADNLEKMCGLISTFSVDGDFKVTKNFKDPKTVLLEMPLLKNLLFKGFFASPPEQLFALSGKQLFRGATRCRQFSHLYGAFAPMNVAYAVTEVKDGFVRASIKGMNKLQMFSLAELMEQSACREAFKVDHVKMIGSGTAEGHGQWSLTNGMVYQTRTYYQYEGDIVIEDQVYPFTATIFHYINAHE